MVCGLFGGLRQGLGGEVVQNPRQAQTDNNDNNNNNTMTAHFLNFYSAWRGPSKPNYLKTKQESQPSECIHLVPARSQVFRDSTTWKSGA